MAIDYYNCEAFRYEKQFYPDTLGSHIKIADKALRVIQACNIESGSKVLELGCGTGIYTRTFASIGAIVTAVDGSTGMLNLARIKGGATFVLADVNELQFGPEFDCVVGVYILQYTNIENVLTRVKSALKPGGRVAFIESNVFNPVTLWCAWRNKVAHPLPRWEYERIMNGIGFHKVKTIPFEFTPTFFNGHITWPEKVPILREFAGSVIVTGVTL